MQRQVQGLEGRVRLGASTGAIAHLLPQALETLARDHPIDVQVAVLTSQETLLRLADGTLDVGLVALPQPPTDGLVLRPWRRDPVLAFLPASWQAPARLTPAWLAERPLILNDASTRLSRLTAEWFAAAGLNPRARIQLNYNDAIKSLVAAGYGATLLPHEATAPQPDPRIAMRPLRPRCGVRWASPTAPAISNWPPATCWTCCGRCARRRFRHRFMAAPEGVLNFAPRPRPAGREELDVAFKRWLASFAPAPVARAPAKRFTARWAR